MKITERKEVTVTQIENVLIGRKCDFCGKDILVDPRIQCHNYFRITTHHSDWGNDSIESYQDYDACSADCAIQCAERYLKAAEQSGINTKTIEIVHVRNLDDGASDRW